MISETTKSVLQVLLSVLIGLAVFFLLLITVVMFTGVISSNEIGIITLLAALLAVAAGYVGHRVLRRRARPDNSPR